MWACVAPSFLGAEKDSVCHLMFSVLETTRIYLNKVKYLHIKIDIIKPVFKLKYIWQFCVNL